MAQNLLTALNTLLLLMALLLCCMHASGQSFSSPFGTCSKGVRVTDENYPMYLHILSSVHLNKSFLIFFHNFCVLSHFWNLMDL